MRSWSGRHRDVWLYFEDGFYAYKVSPGDKYLITNFVWAGSGSKLAGFSDVWTVNGNAATREFTADQTSQNGVKLRNVREHEVTFPFEIWYSVKRNIARSYLDFENSGIEWKDGGTLLTLDKKFDFGTSGLSVNFDSLKINNLNDIKLGESMTLLNAGSYYDYTLFYDKVKPSLDKIKSIEFNSNPTNSISASSTINMQTGITTSNGNSALTLNVQSYTLNALDVNLSRIGNGGDAWNTEKPLYTGLQAGSANPDVKRQDYSADPLTVTVKYDALAGGTTDANFKAGSTMTLVQLLGANTNRITTKYIDYDETLPIGSNQGLNLERVKFSDASTGGVAVSGTHNDTLSVVNDTDSSGTSRYNLNYTIGNKQITGVGSSATGIDLSNVKGGFVASDDGYMFTKDITLDLSQTKFINWANAGSYTLLDLTNATEEIISFTSKQKRLISLLLLRPLQTKNMQWFPRRMA